MSSSRRFWFKRSLGAGSAWLLVQSLTGCAVTPSRPIPPAPTGSSTPSTKPVPQPASPVVQGQAPGDLPPIIFVHGNGDTAALWTTTIWRFESNGWPRNRLFAFDFKFPLARSNDQVPQPGRSGSADQLNELAAEVARVRAATGAAKVILIGNSRGGFAIRNYIRNGQGRQTVLAAIMGGTPNHGVWRSTVFNPQSEFNASSSFLTNLNSPQGPDGSEVTPGVFFMTIRSDSNDKFAQPDGRWIGQPGTPTGVTFDSPALRGAQNVVLRDRDHRETSFHPEAFAAMFKFLTGNNPSRLSIVTESQVILNGKITGLSNGAPVGGSDGELSNLPLPGATLSVFEVSASTGQRLGPVVHQRTVGGDGQWGPFSAKSSAHYEFVIDAPGFATTHLYRSPFSRSSQHVHMRPVKIAPADRDGFSVVTMTRPRGYFGVGRDTMSLDGKPPAGLNPGVAGLSVSKVKLNTAGVRTMIAEFNGERIAVQTWPVRGNAVVFAEFHQ